MVEAVSKDDFLRLEKKVDDLHNDYRALIEFRERQSDQGRRIGELEARMKADEDVTKVLDKKVDQWINRGIGVWALALTVYTILNSNAAQLLIRGGK